MASSVFAVALAVFAAAAHKGCFRRFCAEIWALFACIWGEWFNVAVRNSALWVRLAQVFALLNERQGSAH